MKAKIATDGGINVSCKREERENAVGSKVNWRKWVR
jgi:hypothetical protein